MPQIDIIQGIVVGGAGGACAGIALLLVGWIVQFFRDCSDKKKLYQWLRNNTLNAEANQKYRSTRSIASFNNMTEDRVRYLCSVHKDIYMSTGKTPDLWSAYPRDPMQ